MQNSYLQWFDKDQQVQRLEIIDKVFIGRVCRGIDRRKRIRLQDPLVSRSHAEITQRTTLLQITDTSKNGTWVNDIRMAAGSVKNLDSGDVIRIGDSIFKVFCPTITVPVGDSSATEATKVTPIDLEVTSLVADLRGFTAFSQDHAPIEVYGMIKEIFDEFSIIIENYKGTIKDYAGDAVFAFWDHTIGEPGNRAALVCQAAIRQSQCLERILAKLSREYSDCGQLQMGWGITTGKVTMAHYGLRAADLAMVGDCINLAFRLSGIANRERPEKILLCSRTAELVHENLVPKDLGFLSIKGRKGTERIFSLEID
ncbi:MAG: adenylate/guanylate cyclase domain-containing protein [Deltaproteobacteria bacterium]|nr:adenylate/guanylate cyclase domain-containing protein [Deltaproteobacteria bacterium]